MSDLSDKDKTFRTEIGQKATVQRLKVDAESASIPNRRLADLGLECHPLPDKESVKYLGSAAVHVYASELVGQLFFVSQTQPLALYRCPQELAAKAFDDLLGTMKEMYGHRRPKLRSGF